MVRGVIFGVEYLIFVTKEKMVGKMVFLACMFGHFGALMGPLIVRDGRYAFPR